MSRRFLELYDAYFDDVYRYVYARVGDRHDTDDIVSAVFEKAFLHRRALERAFSPKAYLFAMARHAVIDHYRRSAVRAAEEPFEPGSPAEGRYGAFQAPLPGEEDDALHCLREALLLLKPFDRELIELKYFADLRYDEIAQIVERSVSALKTRVSRIMQKLGAWIRACLDEVNRDGKAADRSRAGAHAPERTAHRE
ncbi:MAG: RNA polymerase sigma factor [Hydrogenibacillus sp.]|nr:RNA polymerase sigma factor [Hydrogenibacillus sp.]